MGVPISNVTRRVVYAASGTGPYNFTFEILAATDIAVYRDDTLLTITTDYTVTINANGTGFVTLVATPTGATQIAIVGDRTISRISDFVTGGDFFANTLNDELDQQTIFNQQNAEGLSRALQAPQTDPTTINMTLPRKSVRANKYLAFDINGDPVAESGTAETGGLGTFAYMNASEAVITGGSINATSVGATTPNSGAFTTLSSNSTTTLNGTTIPASKTLADIDSSQTLTNKTLGSGTVISSGTINSVSVGATTPSTGAFTTLSSTGNTTLGDAAGDTLTINATVQPGVIVSGSSSGDAVRITQTGAGNALLIEDSTNPDATPFVVDALGDVGIGVSVPAALLHIAGGTASANTAPIKINSGTIQTTAEAGTIEFDGTTLYSTANTNFKRGALPLTNYSSGTGVALGTNTEATLANLLPAANDTITLSIGTYFIDTSFIITRGPTSVTSATARLNILGTGTAAGNFSGMSLSSATAGAATSNFAFDAVNINVSNVLTAASATAAGVYTITLRGVLKVTTSGTIVPQYSLSANINAAGTVAKVLYLRLQAMDTQSAAAFGPAGTGWG